MKIIWSYDRKSKTHKAQANRYEATVQRQTRDRYLWIVHKTGRDGAKDLPSAGGAEYTLESAKRSAIKKINGFIRTDEAQAQGRLSMPFA